MRRIMGFAVLACAALALSACAGFRDRASDYICKHPTEVAAGARASIIAADKIKDPALREAAITAANLLLDQVAACPSLPAPTPTPAATPPSPPG
jgi:hypothetical protein